jgi:hypothetical protein
MTNWVRTIKGVGNAMGKFPEASAADVAKEVSVILARDDAYEVDDDFTELVDELAAYGRDEEETEGYFDAIMSCIYDWADANRVWIEPTL